MYYEYLFFREGSTGTKSDIESGAIHEFMKKWTPLMARAQVIKQRIDAYYATPEPGRTFAKARSRLMLLTSMSQYDMSPEAVITRFAGELPELFEGLEEGQLPSTVTVENDFRRMTVSFSNLMLQSPMRPAAEP